MLESSFPATSSSESSTKTAAALGAWTAAFVYGANPNLIYMQTTAMTESLYLCLFIWAVVFFAEFVRERQGVGFSGASKPSHTQADVSLQRCAWCLATAELTRYDGWVLSAAIGVAMLVFAMRRDRETGQEDHSLRRTTLKCLLIISCVPVFWFAYNRAVYGNALEFATGAYSAKAIEQRVGAPNPALHNAGVAAIYFLKSAQLNMADGNWGRLWVAAAFATLLLAAWKLRPQVALILLLWIPLAFYALSIAYGSVPIHVSVWWPFATFNQRYGLQLLPMFAVSAGVLVAFVYQFVSSTRHSGKLVAVLVALMVGMIVASYASVWNAKPQCLAEAERNWRIRSPLDSAVERVVKELPRHSMFLMDLSEHVGIMQQAGIPLRQVVNSENHRLWKRPDPEGLWERTLADPPRYVDFVIAFDGDEVDRYANKTKLTELTELHATGQPPARIYATRVALNSPQ
jgi:hypothetical protein